MPGRISRDCVVIISYGKSRRLLDEPDLMLSCADTERLHVCTLLVSTHSSHSGAIWMAHNAPVPYKHQETQMLSRPFQICILGLLQLHLMILNTEPSVRVCTCPV